MTSQPTPLWTPEPSRIERSTLTRFRHYVERTTDLTFPDYAALWKWSVTELEAFWASTWDFFGLNDISSYDRVLARESMPGAEWFTGSHLNFAGCLLAQGHADEVAIVATDETGTVTEWTRQRLRDETAALAATLTRLGIGAGDVVVGYLPNVAEAIVAFLATAALGATWSCVGQDYAADAALDRFSQLAPKVLVTATGYHFNGRIHDRSGEVAALQRGLTALRETIVVDRLGRAGNVAGQSWRAATSTPAPLNPVEVPFDHPLWVLFSSGTTGLPKGLVHGHGGILVEVLKQLGLHWDLHADDRLFWYTSPSWMMWNLQLSALLLGASVVCYDGSPTFPDTGAMWRLAEKAKVTFFGTSPGYLQASEAAGLVPGRDLDLTSLRAVGSTGSPLSPQSHRWAADNVAAVPLWSMSGGTDVASAFVGGAPTVPIFAGELSVRSLGVAVEAWDAEGHAVPHGAVGELVITRPMPSMPVTLWNDPGYDRYREAYFSTYSNAWRQGDWITLTDRGTVVIHGRSDSTLNRNGVRMGSADIYAAVEAVPGVTEALVIGAEQADGSYWMPLFVVLEKGRNLSDDLAGLIKNAIRERASVRHVPDEVIAVPGIPHTRTGKKLEVPVKRLLQGAAPTEVANPASIDAPELLDVYAEIARDHARGQRADCRGLTM